jgi:hypothetical protein
MLSWVEPWAANREQTILERRKLLNSEETMKRIASLVGLIL